MAQNMSFMNFKIPWVKGRQGTGYFKFKILESRLFKCDLYLLKYPPGSSIPFHFDKVKNHRHYRLNILLKKATGGEFVSVTRNGWINMHKNKRIVLFRPDVMKHKVDEVYEGTRYVLSFGWLIKE